MKTQNSDQQELKKFSELAAHWWDTAGELKTLHQINPLRLDYIAGKVDLEGKKVLDIGCGGGILAEALAKKGAQVTGIDLNKSLIEVANLHQLESNLNIEYKCISAEELALERPGVYDVICCLEMLEHVPDPAAIVRAASKVAKPDADFFFSTLNRNPKSYLFAILGAEYILKILPKNTHDYAKFIRPSELAGWLQKTGVEPKEMRGISYNPLSQTFRLTNDVSVNYLLYAKQ